MTITLYHHPFSRAATVLWMLEEIGLEHELVYVDLKKGEHKQPEFLKKNPMGKVPTLVDGDAVLTETAAIGLYLADRYSAGELSPALDDPARATYLRWALYAPSVIEPCAYAHHAKWEYQAGSAGWGTWEAMSQSIEVAIGDGPYLLGNRFTMADMIFGSTVRFLTQFNMLDKPKHITAYIKRLQARPGHVASTARNDAIIAERGLTH
jgi:glutathione S-transferase